MKISESLIATKDALVPEGIYKSTNILLSSKCGAVIFSENIPFTKETKKLIFLKKIKIDYLFSCGEDYQLIFTAKRKYYNNLILLAKKNFIKITKIGKIVKGKKLLILDKNNQKLSFQNLGFKHY